MVETGSTLDWITDKCMAVLSPVENFKRWLRNPDTFSERGCGGTARPFPGSTRFWIKTTEHKIAYMGFYKCSSQSVAHRTQLRMTRVWDAGDHRTLFIQEWMEDKPESERGLQAQHWHYRKQVFFTAMQSLSIECMN